MVVSAAVVQPAVLLLQTWPAMAVLVAVVPGMSATWHRLRAMAASVVAAAAAWALLRPRLVLAVQAQC